MMTPKTFIGGINLRENKEATKDKSIEIILPGKELVYPLKGKVGNSAKAIVKVGDKVLTGQKIGKADGFFSVPVHSGVSGVVRGIKQRTLASGEKTRCIIIENDELYDEIEYPAPRPVSEMANPDIINRIQDAGLVGMSGSGYPTHIKVSPPNPDKISHVIINGLECEPYLTNDYRLMLEEADRLLSGLKILLKLFPYARGVIAITENKSACFDLLQAKTLKMSRISIKIFKNKYPQGSDRQLIMATTGRLIDSVTMPAEVGVVVFNVETVINIHRAVITGRNLTSRIVTVAGTAILKPQSFSVRLGTSYDTLINMVGGFLKEPSKIISGGPMMGHALADPNVPVTKTSSAVLCFEKDEVTVSHRTACINCLKCVSVCPERLLPHKLWLFAENNNEEAFIEYAGKECLKCGCCSYICPAKLPLTEKIVLMKDKDEKSEE